MIRVAVMQEMCSNVRFSRDITINIWLLSVNLHNDRFQYQIVVYFWLLVFILKYKYHCDQIIMYSTQMDYFMQYANSGIQTDNSHYARNEWY